MSEIRGSKWWRALHPWHKMAVILFYPQLSNNDLALELRLGTKNMIVGARDRLKKRIGEKKIIPLPCAPEEVSSLAIPPEAPLHRPSYITNYWARKSFEPGGKKPITPVRPPIIETTKICCTEKCGKTTLPNLRFCVACVKLTYNPLPPQIEALIASVT